MVIMCTQFQYGFPHAVFRWTFEVGCMEKVRQRERARKKDRARDKERRRLTRKGGRQIERESVLVSCSFWDRFGLER